MLWRTFERNYRNIFPVSLLLVRVLVRIFIPVKGVDPKKRASGKLGLEYSNFPYRNLGGVSVLQKYMDKGVA
jgi:hypothetical protein